MNAKDETDMNYTRDETGAVRAGSEASPEPRRDRVDPLSLVAGLVFVAVALAVLVERFWVEIDPVLVAGGAVAAVGAAIIVVAVLRSSRRDHEPGGDPRRDR